jgi:hypothetical protein
MKSCLEGGSGKKKSDKGKEKTKKCFKDSFDAQIVES